MPTVFTVTNALDAGAGSLRQAVLDSNALAGADEIRFDATAFATPQTITLTTGELLVTDDLTVTGLGVDRIAISGNNASRVFHIDDGNAAVARAVAFSGLTVTGGRAANNGGGIRNAEALTLVGTVVSGNAVVRSSGSGGGIYSYGTLTLTASTVSGNTVTALGRFGYASGGGINSSGTLAMTDSTVSGNTAGGTGGGITSRGYSYGRSRVTLTGVTVAGNSAPVGGGIANWTGSDLTLTNTIVADSVGGEDVFRSGEPDENRLRLDELVRTGAVTIMPFGRYRGRRIDMIPDDYLLWAVKSFDKMTPDLRRAIKRHLIDR